MKDPFDAVAATLASARAAWAAAEESGLGLDGYEGAALVAVNAAVAELRRQVDAVHARVAARIARASRPELGSAGLARQEGYRSPAALIAAASGSSVGAAARLIRVGEATEPRMTLTGDPRPSRYPSIGGAVEYGRIGIDAAAAIIALLDRVALRAGHEAIVEAEEALSRQAVGLPLDQVHKLLQRAEAWLDPDGVQPREDELRDGRALHIREDRNGALHVSGVFDPETGAPVKTAIEAIVGVLLHRRGDARALDGVAADRRTIAQMQADALAAVCRHALGCDSTDVPTAGATVIVRIDLEQLEAGIGQATIDGLAQPISAGTARRMAADGGVIPLVLGDGSEILDFGRTRRLFSRAQKLALVERDGGCAMCGLPPGMSQVHHIRWWERDAGPTDLDNGILLCVACHVRIHNDGWEIRIEGRGARALVWFIPPRHVDPTRTPRLGGRARRDYIAA